MANLWFGFETQRVYEIFRSLSGMQRPPRSRAIAAIISGSCWFIRLSDLPVPRSFSEPYCRCMSIRRGPDSSAQPRYISSHASRPRSWVFLFTFTFCYLNLLLSMPVLGQGAEKVGPLAATSDHEVTTDPSKETERSTQSPFYGKCMTGRTKNCGDIPQADISIVI